MLPEVAAYAAPRRSRPGDRSARPLSDLCARIHRDFRYVGGTTTVRSTLTELLDGGEGVCQDFAHLAVAGLRSVGLAAPLRERLPGDQSAARDAEAARRRRVARLGVGVDGLGRAEGWLDVDPTNDCVVGPSYVVLAHGRDYADVPPLKGVLFTGPGNGSDGESRMSVEVDMDRLDGFGESDHG